MIGSTNASAAAISRDAPVIILLHAMATRICRHILVAMACNRIITGASLDMAAADAFVEPIINGFWFYFLLVYIKKAFVKKIEQSKSTIINVNQVGILLAFLYTVGHILIAMTGHSNKNMTNSV